MLTLLSNHDLFRNNDPVITIYVIIINLIQLVKIIIAYEKYNKI
jgi:hypothetical protein